MQPERICPVRICLYTVGSNVYLATLQLQGLENVFRSMSVVLGVNRILILWTSFLGWLSSLAEGVRTSMVDCAPHQGRVSSRFAARRPSCRKCGSGC